MSTRMQVAGQSSRLSTDSLALYDLAAPAPFPQLQMLGVLPDNVAAGNSRLLMRPDDGAVFVFGRLLDNSGNTTGCKMYVRNLP